MHPRKILIVTKTYPEISKTYREVVCTAGILLDEQENPLQWIRIYPVRYRDLDSSKKYAKWGIIKASIERNYKDYREESYRVDDSSIEVLREIGTQNSWEERRRFFEPLMSHSIEEIKVQGKSLGMIRPKNIKYTVEKTDRSWTVGKQSILDQGDLFRYGNPFSDLEKIPYKFFYHFTDEDDKHHKCSIIDWEISQLFRKMRNLSNAQTLKGKEEEALEKVRIKLEEEFLSPKLDLHFFMGNLKRYKNSFVVIGLVYPPRLAGIQLKLL